MPTGKLQQPGPPRSPPRRAEILELERDKARAEMTRPEADVGLNKLKVATDRDCDSQATADAGLKRRCGIRSRVHRRPPAGRLVVLPVCSSTRSEEATSRAWEPLVNVGHVHILLLTDDSPPLATLMRLMYQWHLKRAAFSSPFILFSPPCCGGV